MCIRCVTSNSCCGGQRSEGQDMRQCSSPRKGGHQNEQDGGILFWFAFIMPAWMFRPRLQFMGQILAKRTTGYGVTRTQKRSKSWKILSHPLVVRSIVVFLFLFYIGIPVWFYFCTWFRRHAIFLDFADWPFQDLSSPESYGLPCTRHFFVQSAPGIWLGVWHILPRSLQNRCVAHSNISKTEFFNDDRPVVLYLHGSAESRSAAYRRSMYRVLSHSVVDAHVIAFDYRGFGDSTYASPTVAGVVEDAEAMYNWLKEHVPTSRIYVWGHSLGSGVAIRLGETTNIRKDNPAAIVLEAPFTSVADVTHTFPLSIFHRHLPFFQNFCSDRTRHSDTNFDSDVRIGNVTAPLLILHSADDSMVWVEQGYRLWRRAVDGRPQNLPMPVFVELDAQYGCGHRNIHKAPNLPYVVVHFIDELRIFNGSTEE